MGDSEVILKPPNKIFLRNRMTPLIKTDGASNSGQGSDEVKRRLGIGKYVVFT
jgi:hypothetical protein